MDEEKVYRSIRIAKQRKVITNQQKKTLIGQVKAGDVVGANNGLLKIVKRTIRLEVR